jgi:hypothetical protein
MSKLLATEYEQSSVNKAKERKLILDLLSISPTRARKAKIRLGVRVLHPQAQWSTLK